MASSAPTPVALGQNQAAMTGQNNPLTTMLCPMSQRGTKTGTHNAATTPKIAVPKIANRPTNKGFSFTVSSANTPSSKSDLRMVAPFIGLSTGLVSYTFEQFGDFVDQDTFDIFYGDFLSENVGWLTRASAGLNVSVGPRFLFSLEGRYNWARAKMDGDYYDFGRIDLDGFQLIGGLAVRF